MSAPARRLPALPLLRVPRFVLRLRADWAWWQVQYQRGMVAECANKEKEAVQREDYLNAHAWLGKGMQHRFRQGMRQRELAKLRQAGNLTRLEWRKVAGVGWDG